MGSNPRAFSSAIEDEARADFDEVWKRYARLGRVPDDNSCRQHLRFAHRFAFALNVLARAIPSSYKEHQRVFFREVASDALHFVHSLFCGDLRGGSFYLRSAVENVWRHFYFKDHPVEYQWLHTRAGYYMTLEDLREYCKLAPPIGAALQGTLGQLASGYSELSRSVHTSSATTAQLREALSKVVLDVPQARKAGQIVQSLGRDVVLLLITVHRDVFLRLHPRARSFVLGFLDARRRQIRMRA